MQRVHSCVLKRNSTMSRFLTDRLSSLAEYVPGEQPKDKSYIKLNTNESPYPPSPKAMEIIDKATLCDLRLYCDPEAGSLKDEIAKSLGVNRCNVFVSNGSDEVLNFFFMAFCDKENKVCFPDISYGFYKVFAELYSLDYETVPLKKNFGIEPSDYFHKGKNIVIANPNAPTGLALTLEEVESIVKANPDRLVLIDEAYVDFGAQSAVSLTKKYQNLVVAQTFSKSRSLAGARLGFAIANEEIIKDFEKIKFSTNPYNVNSLTQAMGQRAIADREYFEENRQKIIEARSYTICELKKLGFHVTDSKANFVFAKKDGLSGKKIYTSLKDMGILVRHFDSPAVCDYNRITIGTMDDMKSLIRALKEILKRTDI